MINETRRKLNDEEKRRRLRLYFTAGLRAILKNPIKTILLFAYIVILAFMLANGDVSGTPLPNGFEWLYPITAAASWILVIGIHLVIIFFVIALFGTPHRSVEFENGFQRIGLVNCAGEAPILLRDRKDKSNTKLRALTFDSAGIPLLEWEDNRQHIEAALNCIIASIKEGKNKREIVLTVADGNHKLPSMIDWSSEYLSKKDFELVLGESILGKVSVDLVKIPHILLGGSTGSGKSVLLKLLLMQCIQKGAKVYIADFKGGVDFPKVWHKKCTLIFDKNELLKFLTALVDELEHRKEVLRESGCENISQYNTTQNKKLKRIVFACDEIAEILDKTGLSKEAKEPIYQIENALSEIARLGRAFGIHLILATQRPDADILPGQIRNNINCRACGRADGVLSRIILDNSSAADSIPKDAQGLFIMPDATVFKAYLFDKNNL